MVGTLGRVRVAGPRCASGDTGRCRAGVGGVRGGGCGDERGDERGDTRGDTRGEADAADDDDADDADAARSRIMSFS